MNNTISKYAFWISIIALLLVLATIFVIVMDVWKISVIDSNSFISALVAIMTLVFSLLVGHQIYNAVDTRERTEIMRNEMDTKLKEIDKLKNELQTIKGELTNEINSAKSDVIELTKEFQEGGYILQARIAAETPKHFHVAFLKMMEAIRVALDVDHRDDGYGWMLDELKEYMLLVNFGCTPFDGLCSDIPLNVQGYKDLFKNIDIAIREHHNYYIIRDTYELLLDDFEKRLDGIAQMQTMSDSKVSEVFK